MRCGASYNTNVHVLLAMSANFSLLALFFDGKNPKNMNSSDGNPEAASAVIAAL